MALRCSLLALGVLAAAATLATPGQAHIDLQVPQPRKGGVPDGSLSNRPCGQSQNARVPERVSVFSPGQVIDVEWDVYVQHQSYFRIAFDPDGDDSFSERTTPPEDPATDDPTLLPSNPDERILAYIEDHAGRIDHVRQSVTLPDEPCERCTLQVTQFTYELPLYQATYYQCADIALRRATGDTGDTGEGEAIDAGAAPPQTGEENDLVLDRGCALAPSAPSERAPLLASAGLALAAWLRRRARTGPRAGRSRL